VFFRGLGCSFVSFGGVACLSGLARLFGTRSVRGISVHRLPPGHSYPAVLRSATMDCCVISSQSQRERKCEGRT